MEDVERTGAVESRRPDRRRGLSRERIAAAALELVDREGIDALTMRRLGRELGVGAMTLYGYFADKEELVAAVLDRASADGPAIPVEGPWRERLRALMFGIRETLVRHPSGVELRLRRPILSRGALRVTETGLQILDEAGFPPAEAARAYRTLFVYVFGFASFNPRGSGEEVKRETLAVLRALDPEAYPRLSGAAVEAVETMAGEDEQFAYGLDRLLDGLEASLGARRPPS